MDVAVETCHCIRVLVLLNGTLMGEGTLSLPNADNYVSFQILG